MATRPAQLRDGRYVVIGHLGHGSQGETLQAIDKRDGRLLAIKRFSIRGAKSWKDVELSEREARVLSGLNHPKLPRYVDHFEQDGCLYLAMEKLEGQTLSTLGGRLDQHDVLRFLEDAAEVLDYLHGRAPPIIHRDIKPGNVIRRPDGSYAFVDFGSVRDKLRPEGGSTVVGTFGFMAPEQFQGRALPSSDVYAVGATAMCLLTGRQPEDLPHRGLAIDVEAALGHSVDRRLVNALGRMLVADPDQRAQSLSRLLDSCGLGRGFETHAAPADGSQHWETSGSIEDLLLNPFVAFALTVGLFVARVSVWALFEVFLPTLLRILASVFGVPLTRAAARCRQVGVLGGAQLKATSETLLQRFRTAEAPRQARRTRRKRKAERRKQRRTRVATPEYGAGEHEATPNETMAEETSSRNSPRSHHR